jgi:hypothetical protein
LKFANGAAISCFNSVAYDEATGETGAMNFLGVWAPCVDAVLMGAATPDPKGPGVAARGKINPPAALSWHH